MAKAKKQDTIAYAPSSRGRNVFTNDQNLTRFLQHHYAGMLQRQSTTLESLGDFCGGKLDEQADYSDRHHPPVLERRPDDPLKPVKRVGNVVLNDRYKDCQQELYRHGTIAKCFDPQNPEPHMLAFLTQYMASYADISTGCPYAMTHPVTMTLATLASKSLRKKFLPQMLRTDGKTPIGGTWATEKHGGSDVGRTVTKTVKQGDGSYLLQGHQWFASAIGFDRWLTIKTARPEGAASGSKGLALYLVPSHLDEDWNEDHLAIENQYDITAIKKKMGTRGLPTGEVELEGTVAYEIVPEGQGLKAMMLALGCSRVHNAMAAAGVMHRAYVQAMSWAANRDAFGKKIIQQPMVQKRILDIKTEWMAGAALAFECAKSFDDTIADETKQGWLRVATALAKYKTAKQATDCMQKALRLGAGNHYTEDFSTERLLRDAEVLAVWEGPEEIQALELLRMLMEDSGAQSYLDRLDSVITALPSSMQTEAKRLQKIRDNIAHDLTKLAGAPGKAVAVADEFLEKMATGLSYALLCEEAAHEVAQHNDKTKLLISDHFYKQQSWRRVDFNGHKLQRHFNEIAQDQAIPASTKKLVSKPAP